MSRTITLSINNNTNGAWCDTCLLPSAATYEVSILSSSGVTKLRTFSGCVDHALRAADDV